jgi:hypothetical protein
MKQAVTEAGIEDHEEIGLIQCEEEILVPGWRAV